MQSGSVTLLVAIAGHEKTPHRPSSGVGLGFGPYIFFVFHQNICCVIYIAQEVDVV